MATDGPVPHGFVEMCVVPHAKSYLLTIKRHKKTQMVHSGSICWNFQGPHLGQGLVPNYLRLDWAYIFHKQSNKLTVPQSMC